MASKTTPLIALIAASPASASDLSGADTAWLLTATAPVLFMTLPGLSLFYGGLVRVRNVLSVLMQCFALTCLMSLLWFAVGYTIAFGSDGVAQGRWIGDFGNMFFANMGMDTLNGGIPATLFAIFQMTFAIIGAAIISGAVVERPRDGRRGELLVARRVVHGGVRARVVRRRARICLRRGSFRV